MTTVVTRTGETLGSHDYQGILNYVIARLDEQGCRSMRADGTSCLYRTKSNGGAVHACAVGWLISDELASSIQLDSINSFNVRDLIAYYPTVGEALGTVGNGKTESFLTELQRLHDKPGNWKDGSITDGAIADFCRLYRLTTPSSRTRP